MIGRLFQSIPSVRCYRPIRNGYANSYIERSWTDETITNQL